MTRTDKLTIGAVRVLLAGLLGTYLVLAACWSRAEAGGIGLIQAVIQQTLGGQPINPTPPTSGQTLVSNGTTIAWGGGSSVLDGIGSTRGSVLYRGASGWAALTPGTSGQFLKSNGAGADPSYAAASSTPYLTLLADRSVAPVSTTSFAALSSRNGHAILAYDQSVNLEKRQWEATMPASYAGGTITAKVYWCSNGVTYGSVVWNGKFERIDANSLDIDSDSFASAQTATGTAPTTDGFIQVTSITFTQSQADSIAAGEPFRFELARDGASASDTHIADAQVICVTLQE